MNFYLILEVDRSATQAEIKRAFRRLAGVYHPDKNQGDRKAEDRFKQITRAYEVLGDEGRRRLYDEFGEASLAANFNADHAREMSRSARARQWSRDNPTAAKASAWGSQGATLEDFFRTMKSVIPTEISKTLTFIQALQGGSFSIPLDDVVINLIIPPGITHGSHRVVDVRGQRVIITINVMNHPFYRRQGNDIVISLPVTLLEAYTAAVIEIPSPWGRIKSRLPIGVETGRIIRIRGQGVRTATEIGDLLAEISLVWPKPGNRILVAALEEAQGHADPRAFWDSQE